MSGHRRVHFVAQHDALAEPMLAELAVEYSSRYGGTAGKVHEDLVNYPPEHFAPPHGGLLVVVEDGEAVAGGAFQRFDAQTAELKRIWTASNHRRKGLARFVLEQLETEIARCGYRRIFLTTGPRQPEAVALYRSAGYTALERNIVKEAGLVHPFDKYLPESARPRKSLGEASIA